MSTAFVDPLDRLLAVWDALALTEDSDRITGIERRDMRDGLLVQSILLSRSLTPHPLDPYLSESRAARLKCLTPGPGQWWRDTDAERKARMWAAVIAVVQCIRAGEPPRSAVATMRERIKSELYSLDEAELKVWHYCRLAGLLT